MFESIYIPKHSKFAQAIRREAPHVNLNSEEVKLEYLETEIQNYVPVPYGKKKQLKQFRQQRTKLLDGYEADIVIIDEDFHSFDSIEEFEEAFLNEYID